jgi:hypothetical protein
MATAPHVPANLQTCIIPDFIKDCPSPRTINSDCDVAPLSNAWIDGLSNDFNVFSSKHREFIIKCKFGLLATLAYPHHPPTHLRTCCDLINTIYIFDDITDDQCYADVRREVDISMDALRSVFYPLHSGRKCKD